MTSALLGVDVSVRNTAINFSNMAFTFSHTVACDRRKTPFVALTLCNVFTGV